MSSAQVAQLLMVVTALALLGVTVWAWRGRSRAARFWMPETPTGSWQLERCVLLGAPTVALMLLDVTVMLVVGTPAATAVCGTILLVLCLPGLYFLLAFLPVPRCLYPRWAKQIKVWRTYANERLDAWLAQRKSRP